MSGKASQSRREVAGAVALYCVCSSSLLFLNKVAVSDLHLRPGAIVVIQVSFSTTMCFVLGALRVIEIDGVGDLRRVRLFAAYVFGFVGSIYSSAMALRRSNVETVIVFRASTPLAVAVLDFVFLGRALPSFSSTTALGLTASSAVAYVATDAQFVVEGLEGYTWAFIYWSLVCFEMTFGKHLVSKSVKTTVWESVFLTNVLALPLLVSLAAVRGELDDLPDNLARLTFSQLAVLGASTVVAFTIGYAGWLCRSLVSATTYTLIGVANKLGTVLLATLFLDKHASTLGMCALVACIAASSQYKQAPMRTTEFNFSVRTDDGENDENDDDDDEEAQQHHHQQQRLLLGIPDVGGDTRVVAPETSVVDMPVADNGPILKRLPSSAEAPDTSSPPPPPPADITSPVKPTSHRLVAAAVARRCAVS
ncbi:hypothetical protein CTAYLR_010214 [Chrysophaeum taylorii]|uniref:Sugar phosphate transporter domain-containing protein n=1 Tax=Chrysophaeum taylorii TaxID=2483200 RepID=A0AAD7U5Q1_9STRA|nr:hypothetical protein CTAYLR_010214 [Chrysophaeum taylorii]